MTRQSRNSALAHATPDLVEHIFGREPFEPRLRTLLVHDLGERVDERIVLLAERIVLLARRSACGRVRLLHTSRDVRQVVRDRLVDRSSVLSALEHHGFSSACDAAALQFVPDAGAGAARQCLSAFFRLSGSPVSAKSMSDVFL